MTEIRMGFIGCGGNARGHVGRVLEMGDCEIVSLCDSSKKSIDAVKNTTTGISARDRWQTVHTIIDER